MSVCLPQLSRSRFAQGVTPRDPDDGARIEQVVDHSRLPRGTPFFADRRGQVRPRCNHDGVPECAEDVGEWFGAVRPGAADADRHPVPSLDEGLAEANSGRFARIDLILAASRTAATYPPTVLRGPPFDLR